MTCCICLGEVVQDTSGASEVQPLSGLRDETRAGPHDLDHYRGTFDDDDLGAVVTLVPCGHVMHSGCLRRWLLSKSKLREASCPLCRAKIPSRQVCALMGERPLVRDGLDVCLNSWPVRIIGLGSCCLVCGSFYAWSIHDRVLRCAPLQEVHDCLEQFYDPQRIHIIKVGVDCGVDRFSSDRPNISYASWDEERNHVLSAEEATSEADELAVRTARSLFVLDQPTPDNLLRICRESPVSLQDIIATARETEAKASSGTDLDDSSDPEHSAADNQSSVANMSRESVLVADRGGPDAARGFGAVQRRAFLRGERS